MNKTANSWNTAYVLNKKEYEQEPSNLPTLILLISSMDQLIREAALGDKAKLLEEQVNHLESFLSNYPKHEELEKVQKYLQRCLENQFNFYKSSKNTDGAVQSGKKLNSLGLMSAELKAEWMKFILNSKREKKEEAYRFWLSKAASHTKEWMVKFLLVPSIIYELSNTALYELEELLEELAEDHEHFHNFYIIVLEEKWKRHANTDLSLDEKVDILRSLIKATDLRTYKELAAEFLLVIETQLKGNIDEQLTQREHIYVDLNEWFPTNEFYKKKLVFWTKKLLERSSRKGETFRTFDNTTKWLQRLSELEPQDASHKLKLAELYFSKGKNVKNNTQDFQKAQEYFNSYLEHCPPQQKYNGYYHLGLVLVQKKEWEKAVNELTLATETASSLEEYVQACYPLIIALAQLRRKSEAVKLLKVMKEKDSDLLFQKEAAFIQMYIDLLLAETGITVQKNNRKMSEMNFMEVENLIYQVEENSLVLDMRNEEHPIIRGPEGSKVLHPDMAAILLAIMRSSGITGGELVQLLNRQYDFNVAQYIMNLKRYLGECLGAGSYISTSPYKWEYKGDAYLVEARILDISR